MQDLLAILLFALCRDFYAFALKQKWRLEFFITTRHFETHFELENSEFGCEMNP